MLPQKKLRAWASIACLNSLSCLIIFMALSLGNKDKGATTQQATLAQPAI
jgi:hypothetical protein